VKDLPGSIRVRAECIADRLLRVSVEDHGVAVGVGVSPRPDSPTSGSDSG